MALISCPECDKKISDGATSCPNCGHPLRGAPANQPTDRTKANKGVGFISLVIILAIGGCFYHIKNEVDEDDAKEAAIPTCKSQWTLCSDNADMAHHYQNWTKATVQCHDEAIKEARFGEPKFPSLYFESYLKGDDYRQNGIAILIEPDAQYSNGFGALIHTRVTCRYDLYNGRVLSVALATM